MFSVSFDTYGLRTASSQSNYNYSESEQSRIFKVLKQNVCSCRLPNLVVCIYSQEAMQYEQMSDSEGSSMGEKESMAICFVFCCYMCLCTHWADVTSFF